MTGDNNTAPDTQTRTAAPSTTSPSTPQADTVPDNKPDNKNAQALTTTPATDKHTKAQQAAPKKKRWRPLLLSIALLLAALSAGMYFFWQQWLTIQGQQQQTQAQQQQQLAALEKQNTELMQRIAQITQQLSRAGTTQQNTLKHLQQDQQRLQQRLDSHGQRLSNLAGTSRDDWLLAEARYLLRLANQRLLVDRSSEGALGLLATADNILSGIDNTEILTIRQAIAQESIALKLANTFDREGTYLTLVSLKQQIQSLPLVPFIAAADNSKKAVDSDDHSLAPPPEQSAWQGLVTRINNSVDSAFATLGTFMKIRHHDQAPALLISEQQQLSIMNGLSLMFEQAQFALLHEETDIYQHSLQRILDDWQLYYAHYNDYETLHAELRRLQDLNIVHTLPTINRSLSLLSDYIERFHRIYTEQAATQNTMTQEKNTP
ncbi:MAG: uroporphyrinogen-III C-methyltransferase [Cellvibrionaceae bacterium]|nr:uroporphyrinogen-III C-methyltransferase [Cellvibrionaceae bacterium]